jgi:hypothetical protein
MDISCAFATSSDTPTHVQLAETLGHRRAWSRAIGAGFTGRFTLGKRPMP